MKTINNFKAWSDVIATWVTIIGVFIGGVFALIQHYDKASSERVKTTLDYVQRFNKDPLQKARIRLEEFWNEQAESVFGKTANSEKELAEFIVTTIRNNKLGKDMALLIEFFENLHACICGKLCDEDTAKRFFGKYSFDFYGLFFPYLEEQRQRLKDESFAIGVESLAKSYKTGKTVFDFSCKLNPR